MDYNLLIDWLRLTRSENVGPRTFHSLIELYGSAGKALEMIPGMSIKGGRNKPIRICSKQDAAKEIESTEKFGASIISSNDKEYPKLLLQLKDFPPVLTIFGRTDLLNNQAVAIVGSRNASANGCRFAEKTAIDLGRAGYMVTSGLARGIDTAAHNGSINTGTIAVVAGGISNIYPPENKDLFYKIKEKGAVVAEMPFGSVPKSQNFPRRNRIISGMSLGILVVEANLQSGSLITARMALEQGRDVFAVPGSPLDPRCHGTNKLIKEGAHLVQNSNDIIEVLSFSHKPFEQLFEKESTYSAPSLKPVNDSELDRARPIVHEKLSGSPTSVDDIIAQTGIAANIIMALLIELELAGRLDRHPGNRVSIIFDNADLFSEVAGM